jgi:hypothetical protein
VQPKKHFSPTSMIPSRRWMDESEMQSAKQEGGREDTSGGTLNEVSDLQQEKQFSPISLIPS